MTELTHLDAQGRAAMVDISEKAVSARRALAEGFVRMSPATLALVQSGANPKGHVESIAELAGIMGAKRTSELIPLCHPLPLTKVKLRITMDENLPGLRVRAETKTDGKTGVEMEALTGASVAALTLYDMCKSANPAIVISDLKLASKTGGKSDYQA